MGNVRIEIDSLTEEQAKVMLKSLVAKLNELDQDDFFGTEGWGKLFGYED